MIIFSSSRLFTQKDLRLPHWHVVSQQNLMKKCVFYSKNLAFTSSVSPFYWHFQIKNNFPVIISWYIGNKYKNVIWIWYYELAYNDSYPRRNWSYLFGTQWHFSRTSIIKVLLLLFGKAHWLLLFKMQYILISRNTSQNTKITYGYGLLQAF